MIFYSLFPPICTPPNSPHSPLEGITPSNEATGGMRACAHSSPSSTAGPHVARNERAPGFLDITKKIFSSTAKTGRNNSQDGGVACLVDKGH